MANPAASHSHEHHIVSTGTYFLTLVKLICLMVLTVWIASFNLPKIGPISGTVVNQVAALAIALLKAYLVVTIFMGVKFGTKLIKLWASIGFIWVLLIFTILGDYTTRHFEPAVGWDGAAESALPREAPEDPAMPKPNDLNLKIRQ
jgi:caa(3)-type oxidase subunit IV